MNKIIIILGLVLCGLAACTSAPQSRRVGADRDAHGCIGSAGYTWSEELGQCIRPWEHKNVQR
jgi:hypothetical protein